MESFQRNLFHEGQIEDFYVIDEEATLGEGANAIVRKGVKKDTGESFAIKIIDKSSLGEQEFESLNNELKIMSIVDHPNIVRIQEYYDCHDVIFIVMELMSGGELFDRIVEVEHYTEQKAAEAFRPVVDAVRYCHSLGIVHRDLKPENLLYSSKNDDAVLKVSDFGYAKFLIPKSGEHLSTACGSPSYIAPEVVSGKGYDNKVDCWSLGVILYVMLCGYPPFYAEENEELFKLISEGKYEFHSPYWDKISDSAKDLIQKLIIVKPEERLSADEILNHPWLTQTNDSSKTVAFKERYEKLKKTDKLKAAVMVKLIVDEWQKITFKK